MKLELGADIPLLSSLLLPLPSPVHFDSAQPRPIRSRTPTPASQATFRPSPRPRCPSHLLSLPPRPDLLLISHLLPDSPYCTRTRGSLSYTLHLSTHRPRLAPTLSITSFTSVHLLLLFLPPRSCADHVQQQRHLFYGLSVRSADLLHAALAWEKLEAPLLAVDMVCRRRRTGKLDTERGSALKDMPEELWDVVKNELVGIELEEAARRLASKIECDSEWCEQRDAADFRDLFDCDLCYEHFLDNHRVVDILTEGKEVRTRFSSPSRRRT